MRRVIEEAAAKRHGHGRVRDDWRLFPLTVDLPKRRKVIANRATDCRSRDDERRRWRIVVNFMFILQLLNDDIE